MVKPSPILCARLRLTTKQVNGGFYRGSRTGSMGAHTEYGGYIIDWRKTRHYNVPDLANFRLTPFVTKEMEPTERTRTDPDGNTFTPERVDAMDFLRQWKQQNPEEYDSVLTFQAQQAEAEQPVSQEDQTRKRKPRRQKNKSREARQMKVKERLAPKNQARDDVIENEK